MGNEQERSLAARIRSRWGRAISSALAIGLAANVLRGCAAPVGCLGGDDGRCVPPSACVGLHYACSDSRLAISLLEDASRRPEGLDALAAAGDLALENAGIIVVLDALHSPHYLSPSGGTILDLVPRNVGSGDQLNQVFQAAGILPDDAVRYDAVEVHDETPDFVAAVYRGALDGRRDVEVVTRYEVRPCEPGVRVRTELYNGAADPMTVFLSDAYFWGDREATPFIPKVGQGFLHPDLDLETIGEAFRTMPFVAAQAHGEPGAAYAVVPCQKRTLSGFNTETLSAVGAERTVLMPGDSIAFERFLLVAPSPGLANAASLALEARAQLFGEHYVNVTGHTVTSDGSPIGGDERAVSLLIYEPASGADPDSVGGRTPWAEAVPDAAGLFLVTLPADRSFRIEPHVLGRAIPSRASISTARGDLDVGNVVVPASGVVHVDVRSPGGAALMAEVVLVPAAPTTPEQVSGSVYGVFDDQRCAPYLGPPFGASPACNRVLVGASGEATFLAPAGSYHAYATRGPFSTLARARIEVSAGALTEVSLSLAPLDLLPAGVLSADFHVHAGASFDSSLPEHDRALTFAAAGLDVIAATDHDAVTSYDRAIADLGIGARIRVMPGVETTGHILFLKPPGADVPRVIGHFNFWPLRYDPNLPRNGAPDDERLEPGALFDRVQPLYEGVGVVQLNHPFNGETLGRHEGYLAAIGYDPRVRVPATPDGTNAGQLPRRPGGGHSNLDFDTQEVMNGHGVRNFLRYRAGWHSFLSQGIVRAGTANSDSHALSLEELGYPRSLVFGGHALATFDRDRFNTDVKHGRMVGTNGPVILACIAGADGSCHGPSIDSFIPASGAVVDIEVRAAPWIPIDEIRFIVDGSVVKVIGPSELSHPSDAFGTAGILRYQGSVPLASLLPSSNAGRDAWLVIEAGQALPLAADLDDDGLADTTDNDADGVVDTRDRVEKEDDTHQNFHEPDRVAEDDPRFHIDSVAPGTLPTAFTNPFLLDFRGDGWTAPGLGP